MGSITLAKHPVDHMDGRTILKAILVQMGEVTIADIDLYCHDYTKYGIVARRNEADASITYSLDPEPDCWPAYQWYMKDGKG